MSEVAVGSVDLFALAQESLHTLRDELATYGLYVNPSLELRRDEGLLCYYNSDDGHIYLSAPDPECPRGRFELFILRAAIKLDSDDEIMRLLELLMPWLIAHELAHHLRHQYGLLGEDTWEEEYIANQLAGILVKHRMTSAHRQELLDAVSEAVTNLSDTLEVQRDPERLYPTRDPVRYVYFHLRCLYLDLLKKEETSMAEFVDVYLSQSGQSDMRHRHGC